jgi:phenylpyruvate tautomerase PptA (4-oxalocrotonate tautomerase family)
MKIIATIVLSACSLMALAQHKTQQSLHQDIDDDGKTLTINISGTTGGKAIQYYKQFNVAGMSKQVKEAMINRITDSLGVNRHNNPNVPPTVPAPVGARSVTSSVHSSVHEHNDTMVVTITGTRNNAPLNYNRNFNVKGLSKQQKNAMVRHVTDSLGIGPVRSN